MSEEMTVDEFLGHKPFKSGGGTYLQNWKEEGEIEVWWHMGSSILGLWRHSAPKLVERQVDGEDVMKLAPGVNFKCIEPEATLADRRREKDGTRKVPVEKCPMCRCLEWVRAEITAERINWTDEIFKWEHEDEDEIVVHAGGACGLFSGWDLTDEQKEDIKDNAGIKVRDGWKESMGVRLNYAIAVVDPSDTERGVQTAIIATSLGDKIKLLVRKEINRHGGRGKGEAKGHPHKSPYLMKWEYFSKKKPAEQYDATRLEVDEVPDGVEPLLKAEAPDWSNLKALPRWSELRANLEGHCLIEDVPWDDFFEGLEDDDTSFPHGANEEKSAKNKKSNGKVETKPSKKAKVEEPEEEEDEDEDEEVEEETRNEKEKKSKKDEPAADEEELVACDDCDKPMKVTDPKCKHCGKKYSVEPEEEEEEKPAPKKLMTRSEKAAQQKAAEKKSKAPEPKKGPTPKKGQAPPPPKSEDGFADVEDSDVDF